jgi:uncharacterized protein
MACLPRAAQARRRSYAVGVEVMKPTLPYEWGLVTGAGSGLGRELSSVLAEAGTNLVLVGRRRELLEGLARELTRRCGIRTLVLAADLATDSGLQHVRREISRNNIRIALLVNNAGVGYWGNFEEGTPEQDFQIVSLNVAAVTFLTRLFLDDLLSHPASAILNISSQAAYQPVPYMSTYAASKAFVHSFGLALYEEYRSRGLLVKTFVPPVTDTGFNREILGRFKHRANPHDVAAFAIAHLTENNPVLCQAAGVFKQKVFAAVVPEKVLLKRVAARFRPGSGGRI